MEQVREWGLPTRPGKRTDSRHAAFVETFGSDVSVELDALPPNLLERLVRTAILSGIDDHMAWARMEEVEKLERETLGSLVYLPFQAGSTYSPPGEAA